jgi:hypothetical protein
MILGDKPLIFEVVLSHPHELDDLDDLYDLDDDPNEGCSDMDEWFLEDGSNDQD